MASLQQEPKYFNSWKRRQRSQKWSQDIRETFKS